MPELCDPYESMTLFNEMSMNNINGGSWVFSEESFEAFRNGTRRTTDWNDLIISNVAPQTQHDISISGGTEKTKFYISMGYFLSGRYLPFRRLELQQVQPALLTFD